MATQPQQLCTLGVYMKSAQLSIDSVFSTVPVRLVSAPQEGETGRVTAERSSRAVLGIEQGKIQRHKNKMTDKDHSCTLETFVRNNFGKAVTVDPDKMWIKRY